MLLDLVLPGSDGIELMQDLFRIADVPVIFLSAYGQDQVIARAFEMGADDYIVKPFSPMEPGGPGAGGPAAADRAGPDGAL